MTDYPYDPELPYVVPINGRINRFEARDEAEMFAEIYLNARVIDTTPKPRVPDDAKCITWADGSQQYVAFRNVIDAWVYRPGGVSLALSDLPGVTPDTVFTVLDERKS